MKLISLNHIPGHARFALFRFPDHFLCLGAYAISWLPVRFGILEFGNLKKFRNTIILLAFLASVIVGLVLAISINCKTDISTGNSLLTWHVDFGIALVMIG